MAETTSLLTCEAFSEGVERDSAQRHTARNTALTIRLDGAMGIPRLDHRRRNNLQGGFSQNVLPGVAHAIQGETFALKMKFGNRYPIEAPEVSYRYA